MEQYQALFFTVLIEAPLVTLLSGSINRRWPFLLLAFIPSMITHPILWHLSRHIPFELSYLSWIIFLESLVVLIEAFILRRLMSASLMRCFFISLLANASSVAIGVLLWRFF